MDDSLSNHGTEFEVDIIGQLPSMRIYTQICSCFAMPEGVSDLKVIETLRKGLDKLSASFPWVAGQVVNEGADPDNTGTYKITSYRKTPPLTIKDLRSDTGAPSMESLRAAEFPISQLDEDVVCPRRTIPGSPEEAHLKESPVLLIQATFVAGGLLLAFSGKHHVFDLRGQTQVMSLLSKACQGQDFTDEEMAIGNSIRASKVDLLDEYELSRIQQALQASAATQPSRPAATPQPAKATWLNCIFEASALVALKREATEGLTEGYVSTDDVLCALIWKCITRVRQPPLETDVITTFCRAVDSRRYLNISRLYPGFVQIFAHSRLTVAEVVDKPIAYIAAALRTLVDPSSCDIAFRTRALATEISQTSDRSKVSFAGDLNGQTDLFVSSWAGEQVYSLDYGLGLGRPEAVRRPRLRQMAGLNYVMPKRPDGQVTVAMCLNNDELQQLMLDAEFCRFGHFAGEVQE